MAVKAVGNPNDATTSFSNKKMITLVALPGAYSPGRGIWSGVEKSSKTGQGKKSLISTFVCFLTAAAKV